MVSNNESSVCLSDRSCEPCQGGVPPLSPEKIQKFLAYLGKEWFLTEKGYLSREFGSLTLWRLWSLPPRFPGGGSRGTSPRPWGGATVM